MLWEILEMMFMEISIGGKILVVNGENDPATKEIYHNISEKK